MEAFLDEKLCNRKFKESCRIQDSITMKHHHNTFKGKYDDKKHHVDWLIFQSVSKLN